MTDTPPRPALAYHLTVGKGPPVAFLPGYASDMSGSKAVALEEWAKAVGRTYLRFDYAGCGASEGALSFGAAGVAGAAGVSGQGGMGFVSPGFKPPR